ncbi:DNA-deoxyinosine glycosylase [Nitrogeniibacter aestuarii]|uniref:DNA-deoxyinosine glycosylase n=1 Tax=Nitrogeniibacter aestuarii TaxID=2815343 RepID=UPI001D1278C2|nr:DNA-deoxyinosine glycosylase [Nitrogeniibacter aestuarii]
MTRIQSFAPVSAPDATRLILGSMPGKRSLAEDQYYAHPQNAFWRIVATVFGFDPELPYPERCHALLNARVALWDVLGECERHSSLDSDIVETSIRANDFSGFFAAHPHITAIVFNGAKAEQSFVRHVLPGLGEPSASIPRMRLPSTSPAHAGMRFEAKLALWRTALSTAADDIR